MEMEGTLSPCMSGGMVATTVAGVGKPLVGRGPAVVCVVEKGPLGLGPVDPVEGKPVLLGGMGKIPLPTIPP